MKDTEVKLCLNKQDEMECCQLYNCCDCGDNSDGGCGCPYCFTCNACENCLGEEHENIQN